MSEHRLDFVTLVSSGLASEDDVDDFVGAWHRHPEGIELQDYLGMTRDEYAIWLCDPDSPPIILERRRSAMANVKVRA